MRDSDCGDPSARSARARGTSIEGGTPITCQSDGACDAGDGRCVRKDCRDEVAQFHLKRCAGAPDLASCQAPVARARSPARSARSSRASTRRSETSRTTAWSWSADEAPSSRLAPGLVVRVLARVARRARARRQVRHDAQPAPPRRRARRRGEDGRGRRAARPRRSTRPSPFRVTVTRVDANGAIDTSFNGYVRLSSKPGAIEPLAGAGHGRTERPAHRTASRAEVEVKVTNAYGVDVHRRGRPRLHAGRPARAIRRPRARTASTTTATAPSTSPPIRAAPSRTTTRGRRHVQRRAQPPDLLRAAAYRRRPRPEVRPAPRLLGQRQHAVPARADADRHGLSADDGSFAFDTVVVRISSDGFYVTDLGPAGTPPGARASTASSRSTSARRRACATCDRLKTFGGTANEFFGFTQMSYPTWTLEEWDPARRPCLVPDPELLAPDAIGARPSSSSLLGRASFACETVPTAARRRWSRPKFGPGDVPKSQAAPTRRRRTRRTATSTGTARSPSSWATRRTTAPTACTADAGVHRVVELRRA